MKKMSNWLNSNSFNEKDEYYTPPILVKPILKYIKPHSVIWCPFDTENSEFVILLKEAGHKVIYSHIWYGQDFFEYEPNEPYDYIISNPPFTKKLEVFKRLYELGKPFAMICGLPILNYQEVDEFFFDKKLQLLIVDKKVSFDGNTASFNNSYFCYKMLPNDIIFTHLENNNSKKYFVKSRMEKLENITIFDMLYDNYQINKPIRLIELFAGYGSQSLALKYLGVEFTHWRICEWAVKSIQAYKDIHFADDNLDYSQLCSKEQIIDYLAKKGISSNYNEPMTYEQIKRLNEEQLRKIYNNIIATKNIVNISQAKARDLDICDTENYEYIMTYSFPCQDLSLAGKQKGMSKDSGTRSGLLWEVERLLNECVELPQILLMENVPEVIGTKNINDFKKWQYFLETKGYTNYVETLNSKDYRIPQNRNRCFMISILGNYNYNFPISLKLKLRLKDMLEDEVDEKYYLSKKTLSQIYQWKSYQKPLDSDMKKNSLCPTITAIVENYKGMVIIPESTKKGYAEAYDGNGVYINRPHQKRGVVQKGMIQTLKTSLDVGVVVNDDKNLKQALCNKLITENKVQENDVIRHSYSTSRLEEWEQRGTEMNNICPTLDTRCDCLGVVVNDQENVYTEIEKKLFTEDGNIKRYIDSNIIDEFKEGQMATTTFPNGYGHGPRTHDESIALNTIDKPSVKQNLRIRKLTPKECWRLMGVKDEDFKNVEVNQSQSSLYHLAGDSIVTTVLMGIFGKLLNIDYENKINKLLEELKEDKVVS